MKSEDEELWHRISKLKNFTGREKYYLYKSMVRNKELYNRLESR